MLMDFSLDDQCFQQKTCLLLVANFILTTVVLQETPASPSNLDGVVFYGRFAADGMPYVDLIENQIETRCSAVHQFFYSLQAA